MRKIKYIVLHCSAGFGNRESIERFWRSKGWKSPGYHRLIEEGGKVHELIDFNKISNGVLGYNTNSINICYIGGIDPTNKHKAKDTRTDLQIASMIMCIKDALYWCKNNGQDISEIIIQGHRDFSPDKNGNGVIEAWERIKECPSFDVKQWLEIVKNAIYET